MYWLHQGKDKRREIMLVITFSTFINPNDNILPYYSVRNDIEKKRGKSEMIALHDKLRHVPVRLSSAELVESGAVLNVDVSS